MMAAIVLLLKENKRAQVDEKVLIPPPGIPGEGANAKEMVLAKSSIKIRK
jgi:hypothetical protein